MSSEVTVATEEDLAHIREWLREEWDSGAGGFKCNWSIIQKGFGEGGLAIIRDSQSGMAVAFRVGGLLSPSVMEVRPSHRGMGYGARIVEYFIEQARQASVNVLIVQCKPSTSVSFWKKMGFRLYGESFGLKVDSYYERHAFRVLKYDLPLPMAGVPTQVKIEFREEEMNEPFETRIVGGRRIDNTIHLEERFAAFFPFRRGCGTGGVYCRLNVGDSVVYSDKMKRDRFEAIGFQFEEHSESYFADRLIT